MSFFFQKKVNICVIKTRKGKGVGGLVLSSFVRLPYKNVHIERVLVTFNYWHILMIIIIPLVSLPSSFLIKQGC